MKILVFFLELASPYREDKRSRRRRASGGRGESGGFGESGALIRWKRSAIIDAGRADVSVSFSYHVLSTRSRGIRNRIPLTVQLLHLKAEEAILKVGGGIARRRIDHP